MLAKTLSLCPRSWKILLLLEEHKISYKTQQLELATRLQFPIIDQYTSDLSYIFAHFSKFNKSDEDAQFYGIWSSLLDCALIPEIIMPIRYERIIKPIVFREHPSMEILRQKRIQLKKQLKEISEYLMNSSWLGATPFSISDITLSTAIATMDYLGEINWQDPDFQDLYAWYLKTKSRPSFGVILEQRCQGVAPHTCFSKIDF